MAENKEMPEVIGYQYMQSNSDADTAIPTRSLFFQIRNVGRQFFQFYSDKGYFVHAQHIATGITGILPEFFWCTMAAVDTRENIDLKDLKLKRVLSELTNAGWKNFGEQTSSNAGVYRQNLQNDSGVKASLFWSDVFPAITIISPTTSGYEFVFSEPLFSIMLEANK